jgi:hypothetical protein
VKVLQTPHTESSGANSEGTSFKANPSDVDVVWARQLSLCFRAIHEAHLRVDQGIVKLKKHHWLVSVPGPTRQGF